MEKHLREYVRTLLEVQGNSDLISIEVSLRVKTPKKGDVQVPDIMTNIRVAPGVAIVRQTEPIVRLGQHRDILRLELKYMPSSADLRSTIETIGKEIKDVPGVEIVKVTKVGGRPILQKGGAPFVF
ncbi:MAG: hypothetical protein ACW96N_06135 [Candidatus Thorarchaeota archaeon]|jgi:hypothetical protein